MTIEIVANRSEGACPIRLVRAGGLADVTLAKRDRAWAAANGYEAKSGALLALPGKDGEIGSILFGSEGTRESMLEFAALAKGLPDGDWYVDGSAAEPTLATLGLMLGRYEYARYRSARPRRVRIAAPAGADLARAQRLADGVFLARDMINTPANEMGPEEVEQEAGKLARRHAAKVSTIAGDGLLSDRLGMIHAVGRASSRAPRLIDMRWGKPGAPKVTLVGKGVCFDTGGLDIKPAAGMLLMKKDMGGAANVLGLASMIMAAKLNVRLRVLIPAVENAISANAFRPGDVLTSRKGLTVEIGNTDAEGRLILADALALADEEAPDLLIDMATLTGAARIALGPDLPPYYTADDGLAAELETASASAADPLWRMPLWRPYADKLSSKVADLNNISTDGLAGSVIAALFLQKFVEKAKSWIHFDIFGWNPAERPWSTVGGEAQCIRALEHLLVERYGRQ